MVYLFTKKSLFVKLLCVFLFFVFFTGSCGIEVGNPDTEDTNATAGNAQFPSDDKSASSLFFQDFDSQEADASSSYGGSDQVVLLEVIDSTGNESGQIILSEATLYIKKISLILNNAVNKEFNFMEGFFVIDFLGTSVSETGNQAIDMQGTSYNNIQLSFFDFSNDGDNETNTLVLKGTYSGNTSAGTVTNIPIWLFYNSGDTFDLSSFENNLISFSNEPGETNGNIIAFQKSKWFSFNSNQTNPNSLNFSNVEITNDPSGNDQILLSNVSTPLNKQLLAVIINNIKRSAIFGIDINNDGRLGTDEDNDPTN